MEYSEKIIERFASCASKSDLGYVLGLNELQIVLGIKFGDMIDDDNCKISLPDLTRIIEAMKNDKIKEALDLDFI